MNFNNNKIWAQKYRPNNLKDLVGNENNIKIIKNWIKNFKKGNITHRSLFLYGAPGIGKTTIAHIILKKYGYEIIEFNASDVRSQKAVREKLGKNLNTVNISLTKKNKIKPIGFIMDEVDGMSSGDRGGVSELVKIICREKKKNNVKIITPVICICNNNTEKKLLELRKNSLEIKFNKPNNKDLKKVAKKIIQEEKIKINDDCIKMIIEYSQSDFRRLTYILEDLNNYYGKNIITKKNINDYYNLFSKKNIDINLFDSTKKILNNYESLETNLNFYKMEKSLLAMMIHENYVNSFNFSKITEMEKEKSYFEIIHSLCIGDIIDKYIYNNQFWGLQEYNGIIKCCYPSYIISKNKNQNNNNHILFTTLLSKSALQFGNHKNMSFIKNKFKINGKYNFLLREYLLNNLLKKNITETNILNTLKNYEINGIVIDKIVKIDKFDKDEVYRKLYSNKNKNKIKNLLIA